MLVHINTGQGTPNPSDCVKRASVQRAAELVFFKTFCHDAPGFAEIAIGDVHQPQGTDRQGLRNTCAAVLHRDHVETATAEIRNDPPRIGNAGDHAVGRDSGFVFAGKNSDVLAQRFFGVSDKFFSVFGVPRRSGRNRLECSDPVAGRDQAKALKCFERQFYSILIELAGAHHVAADRANCFFVVNCVCVAPWSVIDHEANGIGPNVDDGYRRALVGRGADKLAHIRPIGVAVGFNQTRTSHSVPPKRIAHFQRFGQ